MRVGFGGALELGKYGNTARFDGRSPGNWACETEEGDDYKRQIDILP